MSSNVKGLWTKAELTEARSLASACEANAPRWTLADWLLAKEPMNRSGGNNGSYARLDALGAEVGLTTGTLRDMRRTAHAWPLEYRVRNASFEAHKRFKAGGPDRAAERWARLAARPRDRFGKATTSRPPTILNPGNETYSAVVAEAKATGLSIAATTRELIGEALEARAWLASEVAA